MTFTDISDNALKLCQLRAAHNKLPAEKGSFQIADARDLPFPSCSFDAVWASGVLHHLTRDLPQVYAEVSRVLKPGGKLVSIDSLGHNALFELIHQHPFYSDGSDHSPDERPLLLTDIDAARPFFSAVRLRGYRLFAIVARVIKQPIILRVARSFDELCLKVAPWLERLCGMVVVEYTK